MTRAREPRKILPMPEPSEPVVLPFPGPVVEVMGGGEPSPGILRLLEAVRRARNVRRVLVVGRNRPGE